MEAFGTADDNASEIDDPAVQTATKGDATSNDAIVIT